ncbi:MAG: T9SS type A sorting domain-containing protein [Bacteroidetes bacterium]|nr:T9SS type A sorting domain-containing protein [Bacteroidota bacterium]
MDFRKYYTTKFLNLIAPCSIIILKSANTNALVLWKEDGRKIASTVLFQGSTIAHFDTRALYNGTYLVQVGSGKNSSTKKIVVLH